MSLLLIIIGNKNNYCLSFGFILMGVAIAFYAIYKTEKFNQTLLEIDNEMEELGEEDEFELKQLNRERKKFTAQKRRFNFTFYLCAFLLVIVGFSFM